MVIKLLKRGMAVQMQCHDSIWKGFFGENCGSGGNPTFFWRAVSVRAVTYQETYKLCMECIIFADLQAIEEERLPVLDFPPITVFCSHRNSGLAPLDSTREFGSDLNWPHDPP